MTALGSGGRAANGFAALAELDADGDGWVTPRDPGFSELRVWRDRDQDRTSGAGELTSATDEGLVGIELAYSVVPRCTPSGCELERARLLFSDRTGRVLEGAVVDVHLVER
jgi:hypothetical protein